MAGNHPGAPPTGPPTGDTPQNALPYHHQQQQQQQPLHQPTVPPFYNVFDGQPVLQPAAYAPAYHPLSHPLSADQLHQQYVELDEAGQPLGQPASSSKSRRRTSSGGDHVKHRRTRSGCFTCRTRRVKCDEARPTCERCRRGNRECTYPDPATATKGGKGSRKTSTSHDSGSSGDEADALSKEQLATIPDDEDDPLAPLSSGLSSTQQERESSGTPSLTHQSPTPSTDGSASGTLAPVPLVTPAKRPSPKKSGFVPKGGPPVITPDIQFYLDYHRTQISHHHYAIKAGGSDFLRTTFQELARSNEPLLYAVVGFAAYHNTLSKPNGKINEFLRYYNKSVSSLRAALQKGQRHTLPILLTILQLAMTEEYFGDWVNLLSHQRAAFEIIKELYTAQDMARDPTLRVVFKWYVHFDISAGIVSGHGTFLDIEWYEAAYRMSLQEVESNPNVLARKYAERISWCQLVAAETAILFAQRSKGVMSDEDFALRADRVEKMISDWEQDLHQSGLRDPSSFITNFTGAPPRDPEDIVDPYDPNFLHGGDLWPTNFALLDLWSTKLLFLYQRAIAQRALPGPEVVDLAYKLCQMFDALQFFPQGEPGSLFSSNASLGIAILFIAKDQAHTMWARRKLAHIESKGYIFPSTFRQRMADAWQEDVLHWWLPNEEGLPRTIKTIREFVQERTMPPRDQSSADVRDMKGLFSALDALTLEEYGGLSSSASPEQDFGSAIVTPDSSATGSHQGYGWGSDSHHFGGR